MQVSDTSPLKAIVASYIAQNDIVFHDMYLQCPYFQCTE